jgi:hypothetical protein
MNNLRAALNAVNKEITGAERNRQNLLISIDPNSRLAIGVEMALAHRKKHPNPQTNYPRATKKIKKKSLSESFMLLKLK